MIRRLGENDIDTLMELRHEALVSEPSAFGSSPDDDVGLDPDFLRRIMRDPSTQGVFGATDDGLVGMEGVYREPKGKRAHKAEVWGMYVRRAHRRRGYGKALTAAGLEFARFLPGVTHLHLSVSETAGPARRLYESLGFETWGIEPASLVVDGKPIATRHMLLRLETSGGAGDFRGGLG